MDDFVEVTISFLENLQSELAPIKFASESLLEEKTIVAASSDFLKTGKT